MQEDEDAGEEDSSVQRLAAQLGFARLVRGRDESSEAGADDTLEESVQLESVASASESLSSDLSLPHSFGQYEPSTQQQRRPFGSISQFDDHLMPRPGSFQARPSAMAAAAGPAGGATGSEVMKKFYEKQVEQIRAQLVQASNAQRQLERSLTNERKAWSEIKTSMEKETDNERTKMQQESQALRTELEQIQKRLKMEKAHLANLQISEALAEQLSRQDPDDLSVKEFIQLTVHTKITKAQQELEAARTELQSLQKLCMEYKSHVASANDEVTQITRVAEAKEMRLQHELQLSEASRQEMERQVMALYTQLDTFKENQAQNSTFVMNRVQLEAEIELLKSQVKDSEAARMEMQKTRDDAIKQAEELEQRIQLLTADKTFLEDAKMQLEHHETTLFSKQRELQAKLEMYELKAENDRSQIMQVEHEIRLHFEKKLEEEMNKFMTLSKSELDRIRSSGQIVYERENRLLKEARDDALKHVEMLQTRMQSVQNSLDEKVLEITRMDSQHTTSLASVRNDLKMKQFEMNQLGMSLDERSTNLRNAQLQIEMLDQKVQLHKDEFAKLENTSTTKIAQLSADLEIERSKLKEYEQLEVDLDDAVLQTGAIADHAEESSSPSKLQEVMSTFGAIPTTTKRRFQQSVLLAQRVVKYQREASVFEQKLADANLRHETLQKHIDHLTHQLQNVHQPQTYLIAKLNKQQQELQTERTKQKQLQDQLDALRAEYQQANEARMAVQAQLQQVLARREDLDAVKSTIHVLRQKLQHQSQSSNPHVSLFKSAQGSSAAAAAPTTDPSTISKMTRPPTPQLQSPEAHEGHEILPKWYSKLRS